MAFDEKINCDSEIMDLLPCTCISGIVTHIAIGYVFDLSKLGVQKFYGIKNNLVRHSLQRNNFSRTCLQMTGKLL